MSKVRVSCGCPIDKARNPDALIRWIKTVGLSPIVTPKVIHCVYEGDNKELGEAIVQMFEVEADHDIMVFYDKAEQQKPEHKGKGKAERSERNTKLHGH